MNPTIRFPDRPATTVALLQQDLSSLVDQLSDGATAVLVADVTFASGLNQFRHGLKSTPRSVAVIPHVNVAWWQPTSPDAEYVYIQVASALVGDLQIWV